MSSTGTPSQQSPSTKAAILSRGFKFWSANKKDVTHQDQESTENEQPQSQSDRTQRRQQVYTAQKKHRNRKAEYVQGLEAEVARLQHLEAMVNHEKITLAHENQAMVKLLTTHQPYVQHEDLSLNQEATLAVRMDQQLGHERTFMDYPACTADSTTSIHPQSERLTQRGDVQSDNWAALDFILALEWPCQQHIFHAGINPDATTPLACQIGGFHGHALVTTSAVYQSAQPSSQSSSEGAHTPGETWYLPHSAIDRLVDLSSELNPDDELMTPAQAYSAIRKSVLTSGRLREVLSALREPLGSLVECFGFGAVMPADKFWQQLGGINNATSLTGLSHGVDGTSA